MNKIFSFINKLPKPLQVLFMLPITTLGFIFAILVSPILLVYNHKIADIMKFDDDDKLSFKFKDKVETDFRRAIAGIELYKTKFGEYPESTTSKEFEDIFGSWQQASFLISYSKCKDGYELNIINQEKMQISFLPDFWQRLGITKTNALGFNEEE
jgi:hypothetical protein